jgi:hypothetical protein
MKFVTTIAWFLVHVLAGLSMLVFISVLIGAMLLDKSAKELERELAMVAILSFGLMMLSIGIIELVSGSLFSSTTGETKGARERSPIAWRIGTALSIAGGIGFLVWGSRLLLKWIATT